MPLVCRHKPTRSRPRVFGLKDLERVACAVFLNGQGTPDEIRGAVAKCFGDDEVEECEEERNFIEQNAPLLFAGVATLAMLIPVVRGFQLVRQAGAAIVTAIRFVTRRIPWLDRLLFGGGRTVRTAADFDAAAASLTPQYIAAIATTSRILAKVGRQLEVTGPLLLLFGILGVSIEEFTPPTQGDDA